MEIIVAVLSVFLLLSLFAIWIVYQNMVDCKEMYMEGLVKEDRSRFSFSSEQARNLGDSMIEHYGELVQKEQKQKVDDTIIQPRLVVTKDDIKRISDRALDRYLKSEPKPKFVPPPPALDMRGNPVGGDITNTVILGENFTPPKPRPTSKPSSYCDSGSQYRGNNSHSSCDGDNSSSSDSSGSNSYD